MKMITLLDEVIEDNEALIDLHISLTLMIIVYQWQNFKHKKGGRGEKLTILCLIHALIQFYYYPD